MVKVRVHELAKELKMENKDLVKLLEKMGLPVKSVQSSLEESDVERVKNQINLSKKEGVVEQRVKPTVIRRRVMKEEPAPEPPPPPLKAEAKPAVGVKPPAVKKEPRPEAAKVVAEAPVEAPKEKVEAQPTAPSPQGEEIKPTPEPFPPPVKPIKEGEQGVGAPAEAKPVPLPEAPPQPTELELKAEGILPAAQAGPMAEKPAPAPAEKPKAPERPPKPKKKYEPAKIIERAAVPPPTIVKEREHPPTERRPAPSSQPPIILQRPAPGITKPAPAPTEEERGRRKKKLRKDVEVVEEGKPDRTRVITTKKRAFKEHDYAREEQTTRPFVFERETKQKVVTRPRMAKPEITTPKAIKRKIRISEAILVGELAKRMGIKASEVIKKLMELGLMVTINQAIDAEAASLVATDFGYEVASRNAWMSQGPGSVRARASAAWSSSESAARRTCPAGQPSASATAPRSPPSPVCVFTLLSPVP